MRSRRRRVRAPIRLISMLGVMAMLAAACGGNDSGTAGSLIGEISGGATTLAPGSGGSTTTAPTTRPPSDAECGADEVCRIEVPPTRIELEAIPSSIFLDGDTAWLAAPDAESVLEVDLVGGVVARTIPVGYSATDVVVGDGSLWVVTYDFRFGPLLRLDPDTGSELASIEHPDGNPQTLAVADDGVWAVNDGYGRVLRIDLASNEVTDVVGGTEFGGSGGETAIVANNGTVWATDEDTGSLERIDVASRSIEFTVGDLGYLAEPSGEFTSILSQGPRALVANDDGIWVLADTPNPNGEVNVVGGGALFLLDRDSGAVLRRIDLMLEPRFARPGLAITDDAAWYINFVDSYLVRVDLETERQTFVSLGNDSAVGVVSDGTTVWLATESMFEVDSVTGVDVAEAAAATAALEG